MNIKMKPHERGTIPDGPFTNGSYKATGEDIAELKRMFQSWHAPISTLIDRTDEDTGVVVCDAMSFKGPRGTN
jgi:hypothetical protein